MSLFVNDGVLTIGLVILFMIMLLLLLTARVSLMLESFLLFKSTRSVL